MTFEEQFYAARRRDAPIIIQNAWNRKQISLEELQQFLPIAWSRSDAPQAILSNSEWLELFTAAGHTHNGQPAPAQAATLYRCAPPKYRDGWSWTASAFIAATYPGNHPIWTVNAPARAILATRDNGLLTEHIVNTDGLDIREL